MPKKITAIPPLPKGALSLEVGELLTGSSFPFPNNTKSGNHILKVSLEVT